MRLRVTWRWNAYTRWRLLVGTATITQGGSDAHLPAPRWPELRRECVRVEVGSLRYQPLSASNDVLPWGAR